MALPVSMAFCYTPLSSDIFFFFVTLFDYNMAFADRNYVSALEYFQLYLTSLTHLTFVMRHRPQANTLARNSPITCQGAFSPFCFHKKSGTFYSGSVSVMEYAAVTLMILISKQTTIITILIMFNTLNCRGKSIWGKFTLDLNLIQQKK